LPGAKGLEAQPYAETLKAAEQARQSFIEAMDDDFNTASAMASVFELGKQINQARAEGASQEQLQALQAAFGELTGILGLRLEEEQSAGSNADAFIDLLVRLRRELRAQKNWAMSDHIRDELKELGVALEDSKDGTTWSWISK